METRWEWGGMEERVSGDGAESPETGPGSPTRQGGSIALSQALEGSQGACPPSLSQKAPVACTEGAEAPHRLAGGLLSLWGSPPGSK